MSTGNGTRSEEPVNTATCSNRELLAALIQSVENGPEHLTHALQIEVLRRMMDGTDPQYWIDTNNGDG